MLRLIFSSLLFFSIQSWAGDLQWAKEPWLNANEDLSPAHIQNLISMAEASRQKTFLSLIQEAKKRFKIEQPSDWLKLFQINCKMNSENMAAETQNTISRQFVISEFDETEEQTVTRIKAAAAQQQKVKITQIKIKNRWVQFDTQDVQPRICLNRTMTNLSVYLTVAHELYHLLLSGPFSILEEFLTNHKTPLAFFQADLAKDGGELGATYLEYLILNEFGFTFKESLSAQAIRKEFFVEGAFDVANQDANQVVNYKAIALHYWQARKEIYANYFRKQMIDFENLISKCAADEEAHRMSLLLRQTILANKGN